jgi:hypothetical protein
MKISSLNFALTLMFTSLGSATFFTLICWNFYLKSSIRKFRGFMEEKYWNGDFWVLTPGTLATNISGEHGDTSVLKKDSQCFSEILVPSYKATRCHDFEDLTNYPVYLFTCGIRLSKRYWLLLETERTYSYLWKVMSLIFCFHLKQIPLNKIRIAN